MTAPHRKTSVSCLEISQDALGSDPIHSASPDLCKGAATDTSISFPSSVWASIDWACMGSYAL